MKIAASGGGVGDIIYSVPLLKKLNVDVLYIKQSWYPDGSSMFSILKRLIQLQGFKVLPTSGDYPHYEYEPGLQYDYDLDACKRDPHLRGVIHIIESYYRYYNISFKGYEMFNPWLVVPDSENKIDVNYSVFMVTQRWREWTTHKWSKTFHNVEGLKIFVGFREDYEWFLHEIKQSVGSDDLLYVETKDVLEVAQLIKSAKALYCNQNFSLPIAQGLGKQCFVEFKPRKTNCMTYRDNEHILNPQDQ